MIVPAALGVGWRRALAHRIAQDSRIGWLEVVAEQWFRAPSLEPLDERRRAGLPVVVHGLGLSLGGAERPDPRRLAALAGLATRLDSPCISEHVAFVRGGGIEAGHLLPLPRTRAALRVLVDNVREAAAELPVPLVLENIAPTFQWPGAEFEEVDFLNELVQRSGARLLLDVSNLWAHARNHGLDLDRFLDRFDFSALTYLHVAGGVEKEGFRHDTHEHALDEDVLQLLEEVLRRSGPTPVLLERDGAFPSPQEWDREVRALEAVLLEQGAGPSSVCRPEAVA